MDHKLNKGFTLAEILIVLAIISIVSAITYVAFSSLKNDQILKKEVKNLVSILEDSRSLTTSGKEASNYGVFFEILSNRIVSFKGDTYDPNSPTNKEYLLSPSVVILELNLSGGGSEVVFKRLKGETNQSGSVVLGLANATSTQESIAIYPTGTVQKID